MLSSMSIDFTETVYDILKKPFCTQVVFKHIREVYIPNENKTLHILNNWTKITALRGAAWMGELVTSATRDCGKEKVKGQSVTLTSLTEHPPGRHI